MCFDSISYFQRAHRISKLSALFFLGKPGLGRSTLVRMLLGLSSQVVHPLVLGDLKAEHVAAV
ncbi:hypothetical protein AB4Z38_05465 [Arthrobacter sp. 2RAF6]|uniref:hypothetical protein n=1 Tax=unclassified Arthrobacter TaxID=235627 RepID=UPI003F90F256